MSEWDFVACLPVCLSARVPDRLSVRPLAAAAAAATVVDVVVVVVVVDIIVVVSSASPARLDRREPA